MSVPNRGVWIVTWKEKAKNAKAGSSNVHHCLLVTDSDSQDPAVALKTKKQADGVTCSGSLFNWTCYDDLHHDETRASIHPMYFKREEFDNVFSKNGLTYTYKGTTDLDDQDIEEVVVGSFVKDEARTAFKEGCKSATTQLADLLTGKPGLLDYPTWFQFVKKYSVVDAKKKPTPSQGNRALVVYQGKK